MGTRRSPVPRYAAVWLDDYDGEFGIYRLFSRLHDCLAYLVDTVFERAECWGVEVRDLRSPVLGHGPYQHYPVVGRKKVYELLKHAPDGNFSLALSYTCGHTLEDCVTVGWRKVEQP